MFRSIGIAGIAQSYMSRLQGDKVVDGGRFGTRYSRECSDYTKRYVTNSVDKNKCIDIRNVEDPFHSCTYVTSSEGKPIDWILRTKLPGMKIVEKVKGNKYIKKVYTQGNVLDTAQSFTRKISKAEKEDLAKNLTETVKSGVDAMKKFFSPSTEDRLLEALFKIIGNIK